MVVFVNPMPLCIPVMVVVVLVLVLVVLVMLVVLLVVLMVVLAVVSFPWIAIDVAMFVGHRRSWFRVVVVRGTHRFHQRHQHGFDHSRHWFGHWFRNRSRENIQ